MMNSTEIFRKISGYELIILYVCALIFSQIIGLVFNSYTILFLVENLIFIIFFIFKFKNYNFQNDLNELLTSAHIKEVILISIALLFLTWGIGIIYLYSGVNEYLYITGLNYLHPLYFMNLDFSTIPNIPTGIISFNLPSLLDEILSFFNAFILLQLSNVLFYTGAIYNKISVKSGIKTAVLLTSLIFVIFSGRNFGILLGLFIYSCVLIISYSKSKNILIPISISILFNVLNELRIYTNIYSLNVYTAFGSLILIFAFVSAIYLINYYNNNKDKINSFL